jgi:predicted nuclease with TOPRIM domain
MSGEDQSQEQVAQETTEQLDVKAVLEKLNQLEQTNARLLDESREYKTKYKGLRTEVDAKEREKLAVEENWKELYDKSEQSRFEIDEKYKSTKKQVIKQVLRLEVARHAPNAYDLEDIMKSLPLEMIEIDEENLTVNNVGPAVARVQEKKPYMFNNKQSTGMVDGRPKAESGHVSFDDLSSIEQDKLFKEALLKLG